MTSTTFLDRPLASSAPGRLSVDGVLRSEWIKLLSLRSVRWAAGVAFSLNLAAAILYIVTIQALGGSPVATVDAADLFTVQSAAIGSSMTVIAVALIGVFTVSSEYAQGAIRSSFAAVPNRALVLGAKSLVVGVTGFVVGVCSAFGAALVSGLIVGGDALASLAHPNVVVSLLGVALYFMCAALLGLGIGVLLRSSAASVLTVVALFLLLPLLWQLLSMTGSEWVAASNAWLPASLGHAISTVAVSTGEHAGGVTYWGALGGLVVWAAAALVPAAVLFKKRDAA